MSATSITARIEVQREWSAAQRSRRESRLMFSILKGFANSMRHLGLGELLPLWPRQLICKIRQAQEQSGKDRTGPDQTRPARPRRRDRSRGPQDA